MKRATGLRGKAETLFGEIIKSVGYCEAEGFDGRGCSEQLQTAHICGRSRSNTFTDLRNAFALCHAHHRWFHDNPRQFSRFITTTWAQEYYDEVYQRSLSTDKVNWQSRVDFLKRVFTDMQDGVLTLDKARRLEPQD